MTQKLWFTQPIEGLFVRGIGARMTPSLNADLLGLGLDLTNLQPGYEDEVVVKAIRHSASVLFPTLSEPQGLHQMGQLFMQGFASTFLGKALVQFTKVIGPRRSLARMERNFRTGVNFVEAKFTSLGKGKAQLWFNDVTGIPEFYAGTLQLGAEFSGGEDVKVTFEPSRPGSPECTFVITWAES
jgi:uncharacterized protein (TIGR02265 family)